MTDIHCHILDGLDDGSDSIPESVLMAKTALESGTDTIIATPHANIAGIHENYWTPELKDKVDLLNRSLREKNIDVSILCGQEVFCDGDVIGMLHSGKLITLNFTRYLLTEFDFYEERHTITGRCSELLSEGYIPVVAHPERYEAVQEDEEIAFRLKSMGCLLQLNKGSIMGAFGPYAEETAHSLLEDTAADFVASDAHSPYMRTTYMADAHEMVSEIYSPDYADYLFSINPRRLIEDKEIDSF